MSLIRTIKSYKVLYEQAPPERGTFFNFLVFRGVGISQVKVHEKEGSDLGIQKGLYLTKHLNLSLFSHPGQFDYKGLEFEGVTIFT